MRLHLPKALLAAVLAACLARPAGATDYTAECSSGLITCGTGGATSGTALTAPTSGDKITFKVTGGYLFDARYLPASSTTIAADLSIVSLTVDNGVSGEGITAWHYFTGSVSGTGNIKRDKQNSLGFAFTGDMSDYSGNIYIKGGSTANEGKENILKLGSIQVGKSGAAGNITVDTKAKLQLAGTTIWGNVTSANKTEILAGTSILKRTSTLTNVTCSPSGKITNDGTMTLAGKLKVSTIENNGTLTVSQNATIALDQLLTKSDSGIVKDGDAIDFTLATGTGNVTLGAGVSYSFLGSTVTNVTMYEDNRSGKVTFGNSYFYIAGNDTKTYSDATTVDSITPSCILVSETATLSELLSDTINTNGSSTSNIGVSIAGNGTISMTAGAGQVTITANKLTNFYGDLVINSGRFNEVLNGHVFSNVTVKDGGQFYINDNYTYTGDIHISGEGWKDSSDNTENGALRLGQGSTLSGALSLASDASICVSTGNGTIKAGLDSDYVLTKVGDGTLILSGRGIDLKGVTVSKGSLYLGGNSDTKPAVGATTVNLKSLTVKPGTSVTANYIKGSIESVELAGGTLNYRDCVEKDVNNALNIDKLTVSADSTFTRTLKGIVNISELTGTGDINISNTNTKTTADIVDLNITKLNDYTGTISSTTDRVALKISSASQSTDKAGTISSAVTLSDGFTKTGAGDIAFTGEVSANNATISEGTLSLGEIVKITSGKSIVVSSEQGVSLTHGGFTYNGTTITTPTATEKLSLLNNASVTNGTLTQTANESDTEKYKNIGATLTDVKLVNTTGLATWLTADDALSAIDIAGTLVVKSDTSVSGVASVSGTLQVDSEKSLKLTGQNTTSSIATLTGSGTLMATGGTTEVTTATEFSGTLAATGGNIELQTAEALTLSEVVVDNGSSISGATSYTVDEVSIGKGAAGSLVGNLSIKNGGTITLDASAGTTGTGLSLSTLTTTFADDGNTTTTGSLTLGSGLTLNLLNLDVDQDIQVQSLTLFSGVTSAVYGDDATKLTANGIDARTVFTNLTEGDYKLTFDETNHIVALVTQRDVPEPTTATLSLLALMGLAARRRRRKA